MTGIRLMGDAVLLCIELQAWKIFDFALSWSGIGYEDVVYRTCWC